MHAPCTATAARWRRASLLNLAGWIVGTGEVWLILSLLGHPVSWVEALLLESLGQAIRGAAFAIPGSLGAQEGGYLLLAPLVGPAADAALGDVAGQARARARARPCRVCSICTTANGAASAGVPGGAWRGSNHESPVDLGDPGANPQAR